MGRCIVSYENACTIHSSRLTMMCSPTSVRRWLCTAVCLLAGSSLHAQARAQPRLPGGSPVAPPRPLRPPPAPLVGTLGPAAARALSKPPASTGARNRPRSTSPGKRVLTLPYAYIVADAPAYGRGSSTRAVQPVSPAVVSPPDFYPSAQAPVWRVVPEEHPVQAWRLVDVNDVVCNARGACTVVTTRLHARWAPALRAYAFRDRVGRIWTVE